MKNFIFSALFVIFVLGFFYPEQAGKAMFKMADGATHMWDKGHTAMLRLAQKNSQDCQSKKADPQSCQDESSD